MLLDRFEDGRRYKFTKEKFIESMKSIITPLWVDIIDQKEVSVQNEECGYIEDYIVNPWWCEEIVTEPLKTRDDIKGMYKQELYLEVLEEVLDAMDNAENEYMTRFVKDIKSEIERVIDELGLEK